MTTKVTWKPDADGNWLQAANWSSGTVPDSASNVVIATPHVHTITYDTGNDVIHSLKVTGDHFVMAGGLLEILATANFGDGYRQTGGTLLAGVVTINGAGVLDGGSATGSTVLNIKGPIALANYTLAGGAVLNNAGTTSQTAQIAVGDATGVNARINSAAGATYQIGGDYGITGNSASAGLVNAGTLAKINGSGTSVVGINIASTGTISANAGGTLEFTRPNDVVSGVLSGAGQIAFGGSANATVTIGSITLGMLGLYDGASLTLGTNTVLNGNLNEQASFGNTTLALGGNTLTVKDTFSVGSFEGTALINGSGKLVLAGTSMLGGVVLGGTNSYANQGTLTQTGNVTLGDSGGGLAQLVNSAGAVYDFTQDESVGIGSNTGAVFSNAGVVEKTQSNGSSTIAVVLTNQAGGTILAATGTLAFNNALTSAGTITGGGHVQIINSAVATLNAGTVLNVAELDLLNAGALNVGTTLSYGGVFDDAASFGTTVVNVGANVFTVSGAGNTISGFEGGAVMTGTGTFANTGTLAVGQLTLGSGVTLANTGTVNQTGTVTIGDGSGKTATIDNAAHAVWNLTNGSGIGNGVSSLSGFENFGLLVASPGAGVVTTMNTDLTNETGGTINIASGALASAGTFANSGSITGTDLQLINSGETTFAGGTVLKTAQLDLLNSATVTLGANLTYAGTLNDSASFGTTTINLANHTLSLTGAASFIGFEGNAVVTGTGTLFTRGATQISGLILGGDSTLSNSQTITETGNLQIGDGSGKAATLSNAVNGVYDLVNDSGIGIGSSMASSFVNAGLFEKTAGTGISVVGSDFVNNGTITVSSGTVEFLAGTLINNGTINGIVSTDQSGNIFVMHH
jgi:hypothetical protein